jgi:hypothetical protein
VKGIPTLILLSGHGKQITKNGSLKCCWGVAFDSTSLIPPYFLHVTVWLSVLTHAILLQLETHL